jgi:hypothetical protein
MELIQFSVCFFFLAFSQTQALALTRPKTPKKELSQSPPQHNSENDKPSIDIISPKLSHNQNLAQSINLENQNHTNFPVTLASNFLNSKLNSTTNSNNNSSLNNNNHNNNHNNNSHSENGGAAHHMNNGPVPSSPSVDRKEFDFTKVNGKLCLKNIL